MTITEAKTAPPRQLVLALPERIRDMPSIPSVNVISRWNFGRQRWRLTQLRSAYAASILAAKGAGFGAPFEKARISITRYAARAFDTDNLIGGAKGLIDTLVKQGVIRADDPSCLLSIVVSQVKTMVGKKNKNDMTRPRRGFDIVVEEVTP